MDVSNLSVSEVAELLTELTGVSCAKQVEQEAIDGAALQLMDEGDLEKAGFPLGHRKKILHHLGKLPSPRHVEKAEKLTEKVDYREAKDGTAVIADDPWLEPYAEVLRNRYATFQWWIKDIESKEKSLADFARGYETFGLQREGAGWRYTDWAPGAHALFLVGDFNGWNWTSHPCERGEFGRWTLYLPDRPDGTPAIAHGSKFKVNVRGDRGDELHLSPWVHYAKQEPNNPVFDGVHWAPSKKFEWKHPRPPKPTRPRIYETHIGMASDHHRVATYAEFTADILPYVKDLGYNCIQVMAVMEHSYYASFGYQVTSFFAPSSRFGTPEDLKQLIDTAHSLGIYVLLDVIHSHASKNVADGLNYWDSTDGGYFHPGNKGVHAIWDSRLFNYANWETLRFLLSNLRWWIDEYHFDGFRFDGVTTMLLNNNAIGELPTSYSDYFGPAIDVDALRYLTLANYLLHELYPFIVTIAEDACGFPTLCRPTSEGGVGFDYRLGMGLPDFWKKQMLVKDEDWDMGKLAFQLTNRRWKEANIAYVECHDQALVGDKTIAFWLMDKEMYTDMTVLKDLTPIIDRGIQLHKLIRLVTFALGGEGYLTFMGNEFGHPEWIDFPREGNGYSYHHCCRRFYLAHDPLLRYKHLLAFDKAMMTLESAHPWLNQGQYVSLKHEGDKVLVFERGPLVFAFNFHPTKSFEHYRIPVLLPGEYEIVLDSDKAEFGGHSRNDLSATFFAEEYEFCHRPHSMKVYLPCRCALVYKRREHASLGQAKKTGTGAESAQTGKKKQEPQSKK